MNCLAASFVFLNQGDYAEWVKSGRFKDAGGVSFLFRFMLDSYLLV